MTELTRRKKKKKIKLLNFSLFLFMVSLTIFFACTTFLKSYENELSGEIEIVQAQIEAAQLDIKTIEIPAQTTSGND